MNIHCIGRQVIMSKHCKLVKYLAGSQVGSSVTNHNLFILTVITLSLCAYMVYGQTIWYVEDNAIPGGDGSSWNTAYNDLHDAFNTASPGDDIWIAAGTYKPDGDSLDRTMCFEIISNIRVYGGFPDGGGSFEERDPNTFITILSGDLLGNDEPGFLNMDDNSYSVMEAVYVSTWSTLDGITISGGTSTGLDTEDANGGGIYIVDSKLIINNCTFMNNMAQIGGGAIRMSSSLIPMTDCVFSNNKAVDGGAVHMSAMRTGFTLSRVRFTDNYSSEKGGALVVSDYYGNIILSECEFSNNEARCDGGAISSFSVSGHQLVCINSIFLNNKSSLSKGGAIYRYGGSLHLQECNFWNNQSRQSGGAVYFYADYEGFIDRCDFRANASILGISGGVYIQSSYPFTISNTLFNANRANANSAGALFFSTGGKHERNIVNCSFVNNYAADRAGGILASNPEDTIANSLFWGNEDSTGMDEYAQISKEIDGDLYINSCCIMGWSGNRTGDDNFADDPMLVDPLGFDGLSGTEDDDMHLGSGSSCIDVGNNLLLPDEWALMDLDNQPRIMNDPYIRGRGKYKLIIDVGAYELPGWLLKRINYVNVGG